MKIFGKLVVDAKKELHVTITPQDVRAGAKKNSNACAAAQALVRTGVCESAKVHVNRTYLKQGNRWVRFKTPPALRSEIIAFDRGGTFEPGEYKLTALPPSDRIPARAKRDIGRTNAQKAKTGAKKGARRLHITTGVRKRFSAGGKFV